MLMLFRGCRGKLCHFLVEWSWINMPLGWVAQTWSRDYRESFLYSLLGKRLLLDPNGDLGCLVLRASEDDSGRCLSFTGLRLSLWLVQRRIDPVMAKELC
jgi:hypothetical protein